MRIFVKKKKIKAKKEKLTQYKINISQRALLYFKDHEYSAQSKQIHTNYFFNKGETCICLGSKHLDLMITSLEMTYLCMSPECYIMQK